MPVAPTSTANVGKPVAPTGATKAASSNAAKSTVGVNKPVGGQTTPSTPVVAKPSSPAAKPKSSTTKKAQSSTTVTTGSSATVIPLISHDKPSKGVPTGAIVAAVVVSSLIVIAILFQVWRWRSRRQARSTAAIPPPPPRSAAFVQSIYGPPAGFGGNRGSMTASRSGALNAFSESDDDYEKSPLPPPPMRNDRPGSWVSFEAKPSTVNLNNSSSHMPMLAHDGNADPFASDSDISDARLRGATNSSNLASSVISSNAQGQDPRNHGDSGTETGKKALPATPNRVRQEQNDATIDLDPTAAAAVMRYSFGEDTPGASFPVDPSINPDVNSDDEFGVRPPSRQPRSQPPQTLPAQHRRTYSNSPLASASSSSSNSSSSHGHSSQPMPTASIPSDRRASLGSHSRPTSRLNSSYIPSPSMSGTFGGSSIRGAPHLPHVRAGVEIVLPTPLAPQMYGVQPHSLASSSSQTAAEPYGNSSRRHSRSASRTSIGSIKTDAWADAMLSSRHQPVPASGEGSGADYSDPEAAPTGNTKSRRNSASIGRRKEKRDSRGRSTSRNGSRSRPTSPTVQEDVEEVPLPAPRRPWDEKGSGSRPNSEAGSSMKSAPSSWKTSPHASSFGLDAST